MVVCLIGFRHFGHGSSMNRVKDIVNAFRTRRIEGHSKRSNQIMRVLGALRRHLNQRE